MFQELKNYLTTLFMCPFVLFLTCPVEGPCKDDPISAKNSALFIIDVWQTHELPDWLEVALPHIQQVVVPLRSSLVETGMPVFHFAHNRKLHPDMFRKASNEFYYFEPGEYKPDLITFLRKHGIKNIFYCGYATNMCILHRPSGIKSMHREGFNTILIKDATLGINPEGNTPESVDKITKETITLIEQSYGKGLYSHQAIKLLTNN